MPGPTSVSETLAALKAELESKQTTATTAAKEIESLKARIAELAKLEKIETEIIEPKKELAEFVKTAKEKLKAVVDEAGIAAKKKEAQDALNALEGTATTAAGKVETDAATLAAKKADTAKKQAALAEVVAKPAALKNVLKDALSLRDDAKKEEAAGNLSRAYFLVLLLEEQVSKLVLPSEEEHKNALKAVADATDAERGAKETLDKSTAAAKDAQKAFEDKRAKLRKEVLASIPPGRGPDESQVEPESDAPRGGSSRPAPPPNT
jgi:hypothetical protein